MPLERQTKPDLAAEELAWLERLDTDSPTKPEPPAPVKSRLVEQGLAIELVEGGLQLTTLGRERLSQRENDEGNRS